MPLNPDLRSQLAYAHSLLYSSEMAIDAQIDRVDSALVAEEISYDDLKDVSDAIEVVISQLKKTQIALRSSELTLYVRDKATA